MSDHPDYREADRICAALDGAMTDNSQPDDVSLVERIARIIDPMAFTYRTLDGGTIVTALPIATETARDKAKAIIATLETSNERGMREALAEAFSTLTYIFECSDDDSASRAAKEAADKIDVVLSSGDKHSG